MRPTVEPKTIVIVVSFLTLAFVTVLSIACDGNTVNSTNSAQNHGANTAPSNQQSNAQSPAVTPNTNSPANNNATQPSIQITAVPSKGAGPEVLESIAGNVSGVKANECKVIILARTNVWYVQPYIDSPDTRINEDGTWSNDTHLGSQYAALLVKTAYKPPSKTGKLPAVGGLVLAVTMVDAR